jgi:hypothetical protein
MTVGEFQGQHYDYVQRNICIDHLAAPIEKGRCPSPYCGINVDSAEEQPFVEVRDADLGINYHFDKTKYTDEQAKTWLSKLQAKEDCPVCKKIGELGLTEASNRFVKAYGAADVLLVLQDAKSPEELEAERLERLKTQPDSKDDTAQLISRVHSLVKELTVLFP